MNNGGQKPPLGMLALVGLCGICCAAPLLLAGEGGAAMAGYFGGNLWAVLGGAAVIAVGGILFEKPTKGCRQLKIWESRRISFSSPGASRSPTPLLFHAG